MFINVCAQGSAEAVGSSDGSEPAHPSEMDVDADTADKEDAEAPTAESAEATTAKETQESGVAHKALPAAIEDGKCDEEHLGAEDEVAVGSSDGSEHEPSTSGPRAPDSAHQSEMDVDADTADKEDAEATTAESAEATTAKEAPPAAIEDVKNDEEHAAEPVVPLGVAPAVVTNKFGPRDRRSKPMSFSNSNFAQGRRSKPLLTRSPRGGRRKGNRSQEPPVAFSAFTHADALDMEVDEKQDAAESVVALAEDQSNANIATQQVCCQIFVLFFINICEKLNQI